MRTLFIALSSLALTGCMVGPNFRTPKEPKVKSYTEHPLPTQTAGITHGKKTNKAQQFEFGKDIPAQWWKLFHSKPLNALVRTGLANNPNLEASKAALRQAQNLYQAQFGTLLLPALDAQFNATRSRSTSLSTGNPDTSSGSTQQGFTYNLINASVQVSYVLDLWGSARRQLEALSAEIDYQQFQVEAAALTLTSNIVTTTINRLSLASQIEATKALIRSQETQLAIVKKQFNLGGASQTDVLTQETQVAQTRALLPPLEQQLSVTHDALATLIGKFPAEVHLPTLKLSDLHLPAHLPLSLSSSLVRQRPDIRAQEALLHEASAQIGVATAQLFPQVTLSGNYGWTNSSLSHLFSPNNVIWNMGASILQPVFHGGALIAQRRAAINAFEQSAALYRQTVLTAFQNVADTLAALDNDAKTLLAQQKAEQAAKKTLNLTEKQYQLGGLSYINLLNAQRQYQQATINRIQAEAARFSDTAALFQALGGGWWNRGCVPAPLPPPLKKYHASHQRPHPDWRTTR